MNKLIYAVVYPLTPKPECFKLTLIPDDFTGKRGDDVIVQNVVVNG